MVVFIAGMRCRLRPFFANSGVYSLLPEENFFMTIHDAVLVARAEFTNNNAPSDNAYLTPDSSLRGSMPRRRRLTMDELKSLEELDPDTVNDLSILGEERASNF